MIPDREKVMRGLEHHSGIDIPLQCECCPYDDEALYYCSNRLAADALALLKEQEPITGETSDGYHTFNELYHHRAVLFSVIVRDHKDLAWKARKHHDGTMYDGMFIVGIETPDGQATYHYDLDPYWDVFECKELECAPEWDGHTPAQAIERIGRLRSQEKRWIPVTERLPECEVGAEIGNVEWISHDMVFAGCFGRGGKYRDAYFRTWTDTTEGIDAKDADCWRVVTLPEPPKEDADENADL